MRITLIFSLALFAPVAAFSAEGCRNNPAAALAALRSGAAEPEARAAAGACLVRNYLDLPEVSAAALKVIKDSNEDLFLRQDLVEAFADARLRRKVKVKESLAPEVKKEDREALERTASSAGQLLAVAQAVTSMEDTVATCPQESQYLRAITEIAAADETPVVLRASAVASLEKVLPKLVSSGIYDDRAVRFAQEGLRNIAEREDPGAYFSGAGAAYGRLADSNLPFFANPREGRALASVPRAAR